MSDAGEAGRATVVTVLVLYGCWRLSRFPSVKRFIAKVLGLES